MSISRQMQLVETMKSADRIAMRARKNSDVRKNAIAIRDAAFRVLIWGDEA